MYVSTEISVYMYCLADLVKDGLQGQLNIIVKMVIIEWG